MKCLSASIVILAGVGSLTASGFISHGDTQLFIGFVGVVVTCLGFLVWGWLLIDELTAAGRGVRKAITSSGQVEKSN